MHTLNEAIITCPHCGFKEKKVMPDVGYLKITECTKCQQNISVGENDCCVFCTFSDMYCLRKQETGNCSW